MCWCAVKKLLTHSLGHKTHTHLLTYLLSSDPHGENIIQKRRQTQWQSAEHQTCSEPLTSISNQQWHKERLLLREHFNEILEISDTSARKKLEQLIVAVTWLSNVHKMFSLWPRDTSDSSKLSDKRNISDNTIQQLNTIDSHRAHVSFV